MKDPDERAAVNGPADRRAVYIISVAAELAGVHPQTLRIYERKGLVDPARTGGGSRRYSDEDIELLRRIQELTTDGLNLEGVRRVLALENADDPPVVHDRDAIAHRQHLIELRADDEDRSACVPLLDDPVEGVVAPAGAELLPLGLHHGLVGPPRHRPHRAGVQVRVALEHRKGGACLLEGHPTRTSTGAWSERTSPSSWSRAW